MRHLTGLTLHAGHARHGLSPLAVVLVAGLLAGLPSAAYAGHWTGREPVGDVIGYSFDPEPAPCGTLTVVPRPGNGSTDIRRLKASGYRAAAWGPRGGSVWPPA